jgi:NADPH:quinone reductase-like Zn-dependent oxidoreductase
MKAARLQSYGDVDQFQVDEVRVPEPGLGEILVRIVASAVNPFDLVLRQGFMARFIPLPLPAVLGSEAAGIVVGLDEGVTGFRLGDRVIIDAPHNGRGVHAEFAAVPAGAAARLPDNVSFEQGATLPKAGLMGRQAVLALGATAGSRVLVSGALGAVGRAAIQYLEEIGAQPVAGVRPERLDEARRLAGNALDITAPATTAGFDLAIHTAAPVTANVLAHMRKGGKVASIVRLPEGTAVSSGVTVIELFHRTDAAMLAEVAAAASRGALQIPVAQVFTLERLADAHRAVAAGVSGKVLVKP